MRRVKAIPLYLSASEAKNLADEISTFIKNNVRDLDSFVFIIGQSPFAEGTYLRISYEGIDDTETIVL